MMLDAGAERKHNRRRDKARQARQQRHLERGHMQGQHGGDGQRPGADPAAR
jgi:hypothetical protein